MGKNTEAADGEQKTDALLGLSEGVEGFFLYASPYAGISPRLAGTKDSGYDSLHRKLSILERLIHTHSVWLQLGLSHLDATQLLQSQPTGLFIVRKSSSLQKKVICLRMDKESAAPIKEFPVKESKYSFCLEGSCLSFADLFHVIAFCCISRDVLPFTLRLPEAIASARTVADLKKVANLGAGFWKSQLCSTSKGSVSSRTAAPNRPPLPTQRQCSSPPSPVYPLLRTRTPSELECCQSNGALYFINPLFIKVHQSDGGDQNSTFNTRDTAKQCPREDFSKTETTKTEGQHSCSGGPQVSCSDRSERSQPVERNLQSLGRKINLNRQTRTSRTPSIADSVSPLLPSCPRPAHSATSVQQKSMPEKISWNNVPEEKVEGRESKRRSKHQSHLGFSISVSPLSFPLKSISSPISIPQRSQPLSLPSLSSSPCQLKASSSHEDQTVENALESLVTQQKNTARPTHQDSCSPSDAYLMMASELSGVAPGEEEALEGCSGSDQRLSDMSSSTDSLDFSQFSTFFIPHLHDPRLPTVADFDTHLPLSLPPSQLPYGSMEEDDDDEDDEDEEDADYGVSLESDQDQDLTMVAPEPHTKRRHTTLVFQKALREKIQKMSGVFNSLLTPEKRVVRRVLELSRDKNSYFGSLVQEYLSYMGEGSGTQAWQGYDSGLELLQTVRQFITQMKSYLQQSSEMDPPIESLIPDNQIDQVLEKAMHKCILKPLKPVVSAAMMEFTVRSGEWQQLKENLSLAKARHPQDMGVEDMLPPDPVAIEKIKHKLHTMCKLYSPEKKVSMLLRVCKLIYIIMEDSSGRLYGADDFLPMLTYVLAQCDMPQLDNEILYMMELLDPSLLHGEGGYYLTSAYGAMSLIKNFQDDQAAQVLSSETRDTLRQWHRRRTTQRPAPCVDDFQNYLRVALQEVNSGCTAKTLQVRPHATVEEVCLLCTHKFKVPNPKNYGLFLLTDGNYELLAPDAHPQKIKAELHSRLQAAPFNFVFRRLTNSSTSNLNHLSVASDLQTNLNNLNTNVSLPSPQPTVASDLSHLKRNSISVCLQQQNEA
ncbi:ras and Rab interactor 2-like isoform X2 [Melanotaenia boesemani]|nr:ras and Rab interactor 2-like isoform X2 [Melanotaenia boesemani]XP_041865588.1 ras and Rab interactor 2-like isoform X2 [Melanotaenia boesemani]